MAKKKNTPPDFIPAIAYRLLTGHGHSGELAYLVREKEVFYALGDLDLHASETPVTRLIQAIYENHPDKARLLVRSRIYTTYTPTELCRGMVRVAAKSITGNITPFPSEAAAPFLLTDLSSGFSNSWSGSLADLQHHLPDTPLQSHRDYLNLATRLATDVRRDGPMYTLDRPIAALLVSSEDEILSWALNTNARNRTLHAEINLIQSFSRNSPRALPAGCRIYTTLKPCKMCASMIWHCAEDIRRLKVFYSEFDPGPNGRVTLLDPQSPERKRVCENAPHLAELSIEEQILHL